MHEQQALDAGLIEHQQQHGAVVCGTSGNLTGTATEEKKQGPLKQRRLRKGFLAGAAAAAGAKRRQVATVPAEATLPQDQYTRAFSYVSSILEAGKAALAVVRAAVVACSTAAGSLIYELKQSHGSSLQKGDVTPDTSSSASAATQVVNQAILHGPGQQQQQRLQPWEQLKLLAAVITGPLQDMSPLAEQLQHAVEGLKDIHAVAKEACSSTAAHAVPQAVADKAMEAASTQMDLILALVTACQENAAVYKRALQATQLASRQGQFPPGEFPTALVHL
jgi:hypothetical protein